MTAKILYETLAGARIGLLTFNRPDRRNALDLEAMALFAEQTARLHMEPLSALIVTGAGERAFCSGGDLGDLAARRSEADAQAMSALMSGALLALERLPYPVIAAVNGFALGGGSEIALACDLRILDASARLGFVQAQRGLTPGWGAGQRLLRVVGYERALALLLGATVLSAQDAQAMGLALEVAPAGAALEQARALAERIAALDPAVVRSVKALLQAGLTLPYPEALQAEGGLFPPLWAGATHQRMLDEFLSSKSG